jgi:signal transduction histidine kinase
MATQEPQNEERKQTVLIADDDRALVGAIAAALDHSGLQTIMTYDGEQALALARALQPDLILLDVMMPGVSGIEVCATLKTDPVTASSPTELIDLVKEALDGRSIEQPPHEPDLSAMSVDQLVVFARELKEMFEREQGARQALQEEHQCLEELERLKVAFLGAVTHELLTPFPAIGLGLQVLQREAGSLPPDQRDALDGLMTEVADLHRMVTGVDKFAKLVNKRRGTQPGTISLCRVIPWAVQPAAVLAQAREVDFRLFVPAYLPKVHANPELLGEAVFQMAHNAVKFNLSGGQAHVRAFESDGWVVIEVTDTGVGLTPERLALLGQPFELSADAVRRRRRGMGVGWAFVRYVAEMHGGWTRVASPGPGEGSTFSLTVPAAAEAQEPAPAREAEADA